MVNNARLLFDLKPEGYVPICKIYILFIKYIIIYVHKNYILAVVKVRKASIRLRSSSSKKKKDETCVRRSADEKA